MTEITIEKQEPQVRYLPMLFHCWECERSHALVEGNYVFEDTGARAKDTKFFCIPCARTLFGNETVDRILEGEEVEAC